MMQLKKSLGYFDLFCIASGAMISSGIFVLPGLAYSKAGPLVFVSYFLAGLLALAGTLSIIELATAMPKAGGDYFFITRSLGPLVGTVSSILSWSAISLKAAFAIFGISAILLSLFNIPIIISAFFLCSFFAGLNIMGSRESARFQVVLVTVLISIMVVLIIGGAGRVSLDRFVPLAPHGINAILATTGFIFISFGGLLNTASISGEVKDPGKNIPRAILTSILTITVFYTVILIVSVGVLSGEAMAGSLNPIADAGEKVFGRIGYIIISLGAVLAFFTTANAGILSASRYPMAMSKDKLLPGFLSSLTEKTRTPAVSIAITALFIFFSLMLDLETLVKLGSVVLLSLYILTNIAVIILREGQLQNYRPSFKVPLYPWLNLACIILFILLIIDMGLVAVEIGLAGFAVSVSVYFFYGRKRHKIEYALLHLIERIVDKRITANILENELKEVVIHRDELKIDRFHGLVENASVMDITEKMELDDFLNMLAGKLSKTVNLSRKRIMALFKAREEQGSTAISPFVAIPHIVIPGKNRFKLVLVRNKKGIKFTPEHDSVKAVFLLFGTTDERTFHLRVLAAIAHIVQDPDFEKMWMKARNEQQIKDILLLSERKR